MKFLRFLFILASLFFCIIPNTSAQTMSPTDEEILIAEVISVKKQDHYERYGKSYVQQILEVRFISGSLQGKEADVATTPVPTTASLHLKKGQELLIGYQKDTESLYVIDIVREKPLFLLIAIFIALVLIVARIKGIRALLGLSASFIIIFQFLLPLLTNGVNSVVITLAGAAILIPTTFYLSHGINRKITLAMLSTILTLILTTTFAFFILKMLSITGLGIESFETFLLTSGLPFPIESLLLIGITIAAIGILDDITITQLSLIEGLFAASKVSKEKLFTQAMNIGKDHIASVVNTLILVYVGSSLPFLLLFMEYQRPFRVRLNSEAIVLEIVTALITTIGIVMAVPLTTLLGVHYKKYWLKKVSG